jgi:casein kinase II subunit alpha
VFQKPFHNQKNTREKNIKTLILKNMTSQQLGQRDLSRPAVHPYANALAEKPKWFWNYEEFSMEWSSPAPYEAIQKIGRGKYSEVFSGTNLLNGQPCVLKVLKPVKEKRLAREILILMNICGAPNAINLLDLAKDKTTETHVFVFEHVNSVPHRKLFPTMGPLDIRFYLYEVLRSLDVVHAMGIMHRDIKPQNIVYDPTIRKLRIIDWVLAEFYHPGVPYNLRVASRHYKSPELLVGERRYDYSLDIWSLGCTMASMLLHIDPFFEGEDLEDQLVQIVKVLGTKVMDEYIAEHKLQRPAHIRTSYPRRPWTSFISAGTPHASPDALDLLDKMLTFDHEKRITARDAMMHPFFDPLRGKVYPPDTPDPNAAKIANNNNSSSNDDGAEPNKNVSNANNNGKRGAEKVQGDHDEAFA